MVSTMTIVLNVAEAMMLAWECDGGGSVELAGVVKFSVKFMLVKDICQREFSTSSNHLVVVVFTIASWVNCVIVYPLKLTLSCHRNLCLWYKNENCYYTSMHNH